MRIWRTLALASAVLALEDISHRDQDQATLIAKQKDLPTEEQLAEQAKAENRTFCVIKPAGNGLNDADQIMDTLNTKCQANSLVFMPGPTYTLATNMTTMKMENVHMVQYGKLLWTTDIEYWLSVSMPVGFQNQSTVWYFGGNNITWDGYNTGTLDGNGQVWYDWAKGQGNLSRRPMNINFKELSNSVIKRMRFVQSQMWTMAITYSHHVDLDDIYVNNTSKSQWNTLNTDGCDTVNSDSITFRRWFVTNGDDAIALKGNSSNIAIYDSEFHDGQGVAIGSMGQYVGRHEYIQDFYARNIKLVNTAHVSYLKTWAGIARGYPPNGGGGGLGYATNIVMEDITVERMRQQPFFAWQCENYSGWAGKDCNSSTFKMSNIAWRNVTGTVVADVQDLGSFQCSAGAGGCDHVEVTSWEFTRVGSGTKLDSWHCENVHANKGFQCNSPPQKSG